jgi:uncharacterized protein (DUF934 family)
MPLLKDNAFIQDEWMTLTDEDVAPDGGKIIVSFTRLAKDWDTLAKFPGVLGVKVDNTERVESLAPYLSQIAIIVLAFPAFTDGRAYSVARGLRLDGFRGELRAEGNLLPDQLQYMRQVGFESFLVNDRFALQSWQAAANHMSLAYQRGLFRAAGEKEVWSTRHQGFAAWEEQPHAG